MKPFTLRIDRIGLSVCIAMLLAGCSGGLVQPTTQDDFLKNIGKSSITVFPALVRNPDSGSFEPTAAADIAQFFSQEVKAIATVSAIQVPLTSAPSMRPSARLREGAESFSNYVQTHPIMTRYGIMAEYAMAVDGAVAGVYIYVVRDDGSPAFAAALASRDRAFRETHPKSAADCTKVVIRALRDTLDVESKETT